ncbi:MAG: Asp23/Gls24 family envelope stress response protein [Chloroflexi bacterium]|nr:Asp23/Gls24 family envelope stress response protein [Chloroflexota bacterium]
MIRLAALEVPGVVRLAGGQQLSGLFRTRQPDGGIRLQVRDGSAAVDLYVVLEREADMQVVCGRVQHAVAEAVANLVGMPVREVNVYVQDVG